MRVLDLGTVAGPVLAFGGPYSNLQATQAVLAEVARHGATPLCTGDTVAYCATPEATVAAVRGAGSAVVAGNCEIQLAAGAADCGCGFEEGTRCDLMSVQWFGYAAARISADSKAWMAALPELITFEQGGLRWGVLHGGVTDVARFLWSTSPDSVFEAEWNAFEETAGPVDGVIAGHSGIAFQRGLRRGPWVNAGVIGMPENDGRKATRYTIIDNGNATCHRLEYDATRAAAEMVAAGLTHGYERALETGYWPSEDVLPPDLRLSLASG